MEHHELSVAHPVQSAPPPGAAYSEPIPVGVWLRITVPDQTDAILFTYLDREATLCARGKEGSEANDPGFRLPLPGMRCQALSEAEVDRLSLPIVPSWLEHCGPQPKSGTLWGWWRRHPKLQGRFHEEFPDDVQVLVHDSLPHADSGHAEVVWVRITSGEGDVFTGRVLNRPEQLQTVAEGSEIRFLVPEGGEHPLLVTEKYLSERSHWEIIPCNKCGLSELLCAPSDLIRLVFPDSSPEELARRGENPRAMQFTAFCGMCGGLLVLQSKGIPPGYEGLGQGASSKKKWWQFWK